MELEIAEDSVLLEWMGPPHAARDVGNRLLSCGSIQPSTSHRFVRWSDVDYAVIKRVEGETDFGPPDRMFSITSKVLIPRPNGSTHMELTPRDEVGSTHALPPLAHLSDQGQDAHEV
jgi:hypothetical protein